MSTGHSLQSQKLCLPDLSSRSWGGAKRHSAGQASQPQAPGSQFSEGTTPAPQSKLSASFAGNHQMVPFPCKNRFPEGEACVRLRV